MGDVRDFSNFMSAVIDKKAYDRIVGYIDRSRDDGHCRILIGGVTSGDTGYFVSPTVIQVEDAGHPLLREEIFGPVLAVHVYDDAR